MRATSTHRLLVVAFLALCLTPAFAVPILPAQQKTQDAEPADEENDSAELQVAPAPTDNQQTNNDDNDGADDESEEAVQPALPRFASAPAPTPTAPTPVPPAVAINATTSANATAPPPADKFNPSISAECWKFSQRTTQHVGPSDPRENHFSFYIEDQQRLMVWGGCGTGSHGATCASSLQQLDVAKGVWEEAPVILNSNAQLVKAVGAAYAYNPVSHRVYEFGGTRQKPEGASITNIMSVLYLDPQSARWNWQIPQVEGDVPLPRADASFTTFGTSLVLFGGYNDNTFFNSLYYINSSSTGAFKWTRPKVKGVPPAARAGHSAVRVGNKIFFFGGSNGKVTFNDLHVLTVPANRFDDAWEWNVVVPQNPQFAPSARSYHSSTLLPNSRIAFFGGVNQQAAAMSYFNDLYVLDVNTMAWVRTPESLAKALVPTARKKHSGVLLGSKVLFTGGCAHQHCYDIFTPLVLDTAAVCPNSCKNGKYNVSDPVGSCVCNTNYDGKFCETLMTCPKNCTGNGYCKDGVCRCKLGFGGPDCSTPVCPNNCNGQRGQCSQSEKRCICNVGYWGLDCSQDACPNNCFGRGICQKVDRSIDKRGRNKCKCDPGFGGDDCGQFAVNTTSLKNQLKPPNSTYDPGYTCPNHCSGHGRCTRVLGLGGSVGGRCQCIPGFAGIDCSGECTLHCGGALRGSCTGADPLSVTCKCNEGFKGVGCIDQYCARNCSGHGVCFNNKCFCDAPFSGAACELDTSCSNNGLFVNNKCQCKAGFGGKDCSQRVYCKGGCSGNGECHGTTPEDDQKTVSGYCVCNPGWKGDQCDEKQCPLGCSGNGLCRSNGKCSCYSGFAGAGCERTLSCPNNCTGSHGLCQVNPDAPLANKGVCVCKPQWAGDDCSDIGCRSNCYGRGKCIEGKCLCDDGYSGKECEVACPKRCSNKGLCVNGVCACFPGYSSDDCNKTATCPGYDTPTGECGRRGDCYRPRGECFCHPGFTGPDCSKESKCGAQGCGQHGMCKHGKCFCDPGYEGDHCERKSSCDQDCMGRGICMHGKCFCNTGFEGDICEKYAYDPRCPGNCSSNGVCQYGRCFCTEGYTGANCSTPTAAGKCLLTPNSKKPCEGKGLCRFAKCFCYPGSSGDFCEKKEICPGGCVDGQGTCLMGQCRCLPGFKGPDCSEDMVCEGTPLPCSGHGVCIQGKCACLPGYGGSACEQSPLSSTKCPNNCTNGGVCHMGRCFCIEGRDGPDCSIKTQDACHLGCSKRGLCRFGQCFCKPGYVGRGCETEVKCSAKCLTNGVCAYGHCFCVAGWEGRDCDIPVNFNETLRQIEDDVKASWELSLANGRKGNKTDHRYCEGGCSGHGVCLNNKCTCDVGFYGANCEKVRGGPVSHRCPNNCNGQGKCLFGKCYCDIGFVGGECEVAAPVKCPKNCNSKGVCHLGVCRCEPGYTGPDCGKKTECHKLCAIHQRGVCHEGKCVCVPGFTGTHCETRVENFGRFREVAASFDNKPISTPEQAPYAGSLAASVAASINDLPVEVKDATAAVLGVENNCLQNCGSNGVCVRDSCYCAPGFTGSDCSSKIDEHPAAPVTITPVSLASSSSLPLASAEHSNVSYIVLAFIAFGAGIIACLGAQLAWAWYQKRQRKLATQAILTPLLHTLDQ